MDCDEHIILKKLRDGDSEALTPEIAAISNNYDAVAERAVEIITRNQKLDQPELIQEYIPGAFIERGSCIPTRKA